MKIYLVLISILILGGSGKLLAQEKTSITLESYEITDPIKLFDNLNVVFEKYQLKGKSAQIIEKNLKGKPVYGNLTIDDYFVFKPDYSLDVILKTSQENRGYYGKVFQLRKSGEFPEPQKIYDGLCGEGQSLFSVLLDELLKENQSGETNKLFWQENNLYLTTVFPALNRQDYKTSSNGICDFFVPSPQTHYELSFVNKQPFSFVKFNGSVFSLETDKEESVKSAGIVALNSNPPNEYQHIFIVKLVPPFIKTEILTGQDKIEGKQHRAIVNKIYVDLVGIWLYDSKSGKVFSKDVTNIKNLPDNIQPEGTKQIVDLVPKVAPMVDEEKPDEPLKILSFSQAKYTDAAKQNDIEGTVLLRVTFLADGTIGRVSVLSGLGYGLTEQAIAAAHRIKFIPAKKNGVPVTLTKKIEYSFNP